MKFIISLCDYTGNMVKPWLEAGVKCVIVDTKHPDGVTKDGNLIKVGSRVEDFDKIVDFSEAIGFAFPPCTHVAISGARHFKTKGLDALIESLVTLNACVKILEKCKASMLENPVSMFSTYWRKPDYTIEPFHYADQSDNFAEELYTKKTCLWTSSNFVLPKPTNTFVTDPHKIHYLGSAGQDERSVTPLGFAYAVFAANRHLINA